MRLNVSIDQLTSLIAKELEDYYDGVEEKVEKVIRQTAKDAMQAVKDSPGLKKVSDATGDYKKGFYVKNVYGAKGKDKGIFKMRVANKKYRIGHLLEKGHLLRQGGRAKAFEHWADGQSVADELPERIKEALE